MRNAAVHSNPGDSGTAPTLELYTAAVQCYVTHVFELNSTRDIQVNIGNAWNENSGKSGSLRKEFHTPMSCSTKSRCIEVHRFVAFSPSCICEPVAHDLLNEGHDLRNVVCDSWDSMGHPAVQGI